MPEENCEENELDELGIELQDQMPFQTFQGLINDLPSPRHEFQFVTIAEENDDDESDEVGIQRDFLQRRRRLQP